MVFSHVENILGRTRGLRSTLGAPRMPYATTRSNCLCGEWENGKQVGRSPRNAQDVPRT
jgi:hypothetical protein